MLMPYNLGNKKKIHLEKVPKSHLNEIFFIIFGLHGALAQLVRAADYQPSPEKFSESTPLEARRQKPPGLFHQ